jgi:hypothetical protein
MIALSPSKIDVRSAEQKRQDVLKAKEILRQNDKAWWAGFVGPKAARRHIEAAGISMKGIKLKAIASEVCKHFLNPNKNTRAASKRGEWNSEEWHRMRAWIEKHRAEWATTWQLETPEFIARSMLLSGIRTNKWATKEVISSAGLTCA